MVVAAIIPHKITKSKKLSVNNYQLINSVPLLNVEKEVHYDK